MAILQKRKAVNKLPNAREFADRSNRGNLTSVTRGDDLASPRVVSEGAPTPRTITSTTSNTPTSSRPTTSVVSSAPSVKPAATNKAPTTLTSSTKPSAAKPVTSTLKAPAKSTTTTAKPSSVMAGKATTGTKPITSTTKPTSTSTKPLTSTTKPTTTTTKPAVSTVKPTTPTTKTTGTTTTGTKTTTPVVKPVTKPTSTLTKTLTNAAIGSVLGAGTKAVIDKITGKPVGIPSSNASSGTGLKPGSSSNLPNMGGGQGLKGPAGSAVKPGGTPKPGGSTAPKGGSNVTSKVLTPEEVQAELDRVKASEEAWTPPEGAIQNEDGTYTVTEDGMVTTYNSDGSIAGMEAAGTTVAGEGTDTVVAGDGTDTTTGGLTRSLTGAGGNDTVVAGTDGTDTTGMTDLGEGYFQSANGDIYTADGSLYATVGEDGQYALYSGDDTQGEVTYAAGDTWTDPDTGQVWTMAENGSWDSGDDGSGYSSGDDTTYALGDTWTDPTTGDVYNFGSDGWTFAGADSGDDEYVPPDDTTYASIEDSDIDFGAKGGLITMMKNGGVPRFADGDVVYSDTEEEVQPWQNVNYNYGEFDDPTMTGNNSLYSASGGYNPTYARSAITPMSQMVGSSSMNGVDVDFSDNGDGTASYWDGDQYVTVDSESGTELYRTDSDGKIVDATTRPSGSSTAASEWNDNGDGTYSRWNGNQYVTVDGETGTELYRTNENGEIVNPNQPTVGNRPAITNESNRPITNVGGTGGTRITPTNTQKTQEQLDAEAAAAAGNKSTLDYIQNLIGGSGYLGAGAAGGILGALLGNSDLLSGGTSGQNQQALDMSTVGVLNPRTTDFGIGPARYVGYDEYGAQDEMPDLYGTELGKNLNAPGFNPVNEGDYGYDDTEMPKEEVTDMTTEEVEGMKDGGQPQGGLSNSASTYFTFGKTVDPMQNLYNPQPTQQNPTPQGGLPMPQGAPQGMPQGAPAPSMAPQGMAPQGMNPQGMASMGMDTQGMMPPGMKPQGLRSGGLPAWSNVPVTNGRLNFRDGAPVHGPGDGQSDDIPAMLADGEYVIDAETVAQIGNGSTKAGAKALDKFRESIRAHKRSAPINKIPPKTKALTSYLKGAK